MAFAAANQRGEDRDLFVLVFAKDVLYDLFLAEFRHQLAGIVRMRLADAGVKQAEEVVDLGDGAYGATGVLVGSLLFDGDHGAETGDLIDVGPFHVADELAGIGTEALHIATLAFGID